MQSPCTEPSSVDEKLCPGCCSECIFGRNKKRARSREEEKLDHCLGVGRLCCKSAWEVGAGGRDLITRAVKRGSDCQGATAAVSTEHSKRLLCSPSMAACAVAVEPLRVALGAISDK